MSHDSSVVAVFAHIDQAEGAVQALGKGGFPIQHVSILGQNLGTERKIHGFVTSSDVAKPAARAGAWGGGIFGLLGGAAFLWVPGIGPLIVAGSLTSALLGGVEGAVAGAMSGLLGWLQGLGIAKQHILRYEESIKAGKLLVVAHGAAEQVNQATTILQGMGPTELTAYGAGTA
jgi:hypothetical protein